MNANRVNTSIGTQVWPLKNITIPRINPSNVTIPNLETLVKNNMYGIPQISAANIGSANIKIGIYPSIPNANINTIKITAKIPTVIKSFTFNISDIIFSPKVF